MVDESDVRWQAVDCHLGKTIFNMIKSHSKIGNSLGMREL